MKPSTINPPEAHPVCVMCNFDLSGVPVQENLRVTCPECGITLTPSSPDRTFTSRIFRGLCMRKILLPTALPIGLLLTTSWIPMINLIIGSVAAFLLVLVGLACLLITIIEAADAARYYPRYIPLWVIPFWAILYIIPAILLLLLHFWISAHFIPLVD